MSRGNGKFKPGSTIAPRELTTIDGDRIAVPDPDRLTHLHFRRFAGCPIRHVHVQAIRRRHDEIEAAGIKEVVFFHSTDEALLEHLEDPMPFAIVGDPRKKLYREFGLETSLFSVINPKVLPTEIRGLRAKRHKLGMSWNGGLLGLPGDFLVAPSGEILACKYGTDAYDQWSVDELLALAHQHSVPA